MGTGRANGLPHELLAGASVLRWSGLHDGDAYRHGPDDSRQGPGRPVLRKDGNAVEKCNESAQEVADDTCRTLAAQQYLAAAGVYVEKLLGSDG